MARKLLDPARHDLAYSQSGKKTMKNKALAGQLLSDMAEIRTQHCQISGRSRSDDPAAATARRDTKRILILILALIAFATACNSKSGTGTGTSMQGAITGNLAAQSGTETYQVSFVSSLCSVVSPVGAFSVQGPVCFIANNNSGQGSISGKGLLSNASNTGEGVLIGVAANPVPLNGTVNLLFVLSQENGDFFEFTGSGTVANGTITGSGSCSPSTPLCNGMSATFTGTPQ